MGAKQLMNGAIAIGIGLVVVSIVLPLGLDQMANVNTTGWNPAVATIFTILLPILAIIGLALYFIPKLRS